MIVVSLLLLSGQNLKPGTHCNQITIIRIDRMANRKKYWPMDRLVLSVDESLTALTASVQFILCYKKCIREEKKKKKGRTR